MKIHLMWTQETRKCNCLRAQHFLLCWDEYSRRYTYIFFFIFDLTIFEIAQWTPHICIIVWNNFLTLIFRFDYWLFVRYGFTIIEWSDGRWRYTVILGLYVSCRIDDIIVSWLFLSPSRSELLLYRAFL